MTGLNWTEETFKERFMEGKEISEEAMRESLEMLRIGNIAMRKAQEENRRLGLPNVYWSPERGMYYELPDGTITSESPFKKDDGK